MSELNRGEVRDRVSRELRNTHLSFDALLDGIMNIIDEIVEELESRGEDDEDDRSLDEALGHRPAYECDEDVSLVEYFETAPREN